jgi:hypothetical protein
MIDGSTPEPEYSGSGSSTTTSTFGTLLPQPLKEIPQPLPVVLSDEQQAILKEVLNGRSLFFTGSAGAFKLELVGREPYLGALRDRKIRASPWSMST